MVNLLKSGATQLANNLQANAAESVTYHRGLYSVVVTAVLGQTNFKTINNYGMFEYTNSADFIIKTSDLILDGSNVTPERGDLIKYVIGSTTHVYEVLAPGNEACFRYSDEFNISLRIHTKYYGEE